MQNLNTKETMARGVIVLNVSEMPQENISVGKGQNYLLVGDNAIWLKKIPDNSIDSIVTDPPAGISFMSRGWDSDKGGRDHWIAWMCEVATECKRVLKPGGHAFVWAIPRTSHWTATAWENAGFEIRDVVAHIFGSGFPKSLNIGKAVDKMQGNEREIVGETRIGKTSMGDASGWDTSEHMKAIKESGSVNITKGTSEWEGWGTALKPAREDWILMRKPLEKGLTVAENCLKWGTGGINIDESRVESNEQIETGRAGRSGASNFNASIGEKQPNHSARFPANLIHDNSEEVRECFPETKTGKAIRSNSGGKTFGGENTKPVMEDLGYEDGGGNASRFFKSIIYQAKSSKSDRTSNGTVINTHPTVKSVTLMTYLIKMVTPKGGTVLDPFAGSGSTLVAAKQNGYQYIGIEMTEEYIPIIEARLK